MIIDVQFRESNATFDAEFNDLQTTSSDNTASVTAYMASGGSWRFGNKYQAKTIVVSDELLQCAVVDSTGIAMPNNSHTFTGVNNFETIGTLTIGAARGSNGTVGSAQFIGKILLFEVWQGTELALKLIPVKSTDGVFRFFDTVSKSFHDSITTTPLDGGNW